MIGKIEKIDSYSDKKADGTPWTRWTVKVGDKFLATFDQATITGLKIGGTYDFEIEEVKRGDKTFYNIKGVKPAWPEGEKNNKDKYPEPKPWPVGPLKPEVAAPQRDATGQSIERQTAAKAAAEIVVAMIGKDKIPAGQTLGRTFKIAFDIVLGCIQKGAQPDEPF